MSEGLTDTERDAAALAEVLGEIRVAGAREADWWESDEEHHLLIRVLKGECIAWAEGLLKSDWLAAREARAAEKALRDAADAADRSCITGLETTRPDRVARWLRARAAVTQAATEEGT